ncbi:hypothetical protein QR680_001505 [Steinernema hermaphroditum]|uniref:Uncharacterized protein n=1 Tax=Steinernema hermaphroditum TaxID=289476 RepID=A0AA39GYJ7_9BILA|nr:hypothetical protein QR680_001505 [Steinernema hermaphroditum]
MESKQWQTEATAFSHHADFDQSWARKAPFHPHPQHAYGQRLPLPKVYPDQRHHTPHQEDNFPSNYDYPDGSHLFPATAIDHSSAAARQKWIPSEQQRLYENEHLHVPDEGHVIKSEMRGHAEFLQKPRFQQSHGAFHGDEPTRYDMPLSHHPPYHAEEATSAHHKQQRCISTVQRAQEAMHPHFDAHNHCRPIGHVECVPFDMGCYGNGLYTNHVEIGDETLHMQDLPRRERMMPDRKEVLSQQPSLIPPETSLQVGRRIPPQNRDEQEHRRVQYPQEPRQNFVPLDAVQATNPFMDQRQSTRTSAGHWIPQSKVQSVVQMINKRNEPTGAPIHKEVPQNAQKSHKADLEEESTIDGDPSNYTDKQRNKSEENVKGGILKKPDHSQHTIPTKGGVPAKAVKNPPPAPPFPEGILKRSSKAPVSQTKRIRESQSEYSNASTVSTDSALSSDDSVQPVSQQVAEKCLSSEADLLLLYFKHHPNVVKFIGIQLPQALIMHIDRLPEHSRVQLVEMPKCSTVTQSVEIKNTPKVRSNKEKVMRRASSKKTDKKTRRQTQAAIRQPNEATSEHTVPDQPPNIDSYGVAMGNTIISISQGPYPGYPEKEVEQNDHIRQQLFELKKQEMIEDFDDVSRQMISREPSVSISSEERQAVNSRPLAHQKHRLSDSTCNEEDFSDGGRKLSSEPSPLNEAQRAESRSGRFMKKSAAALIAKKQTSGNNSPSPKSNGSAKSKPISKKKTGFKPTETRIAAEIANLREREDELRRNRHQLGLPTLEDIVDIWRQGHGGYGRPPVDGGIGRQERYVTDCVAIVQVEDNCIDYTHDAHKRYGAKSERNTGTVTSVHSMVAMNADSRRPQHGLQGQQRRHNFEAQNVQIKVRAGNAMTDRNGTLDSRLSDSHGNGRLRRHYNQEYPARPHTTSAAVMRNTVFAVLYSVLFFALLGASSARSLSDYELRALVEQFNDEFGNPEVMYAMGPQQKRSYQHIWRNLQMQMPIYSGSSGQRDSKRANELNRARSNNLYRLG